MGGSKNIRFRKESKIKDTGPRFLFIRKPTGHRKRVGKLKGIFLFWEKRSRNGNKDSRFEASANNPARRRREWQYVRKELNHRGGTKKKKNTPQLERLI